MNRHVRKYFLDYIENREVPREEIQGHLQSCEGCRRYYEKMIRFLDPKAIAGMPQLIPDPFLPARVVALSSNQRKSGRHAAISQTRIALEGVALLIAVAAGIILGKTVSSGSTRTSTDEIIRVYNDAIVPTDLATKVESVFDASAGGMQ
jgi:predicted anti-sigma-YlaC factor YlaD